MGAIQDFFNRKGQMAPLKRSDPSLQAYNQAMFNYLGRQSIYQTDGMQGYIDYGYMGNADVYSIISRISKTAAACPFVLHEIKDTGAAAKYHAMTRHKGMDMLEVARVRRKAFAEVTDHPAMQILRTPNPDQSAFEFWENYFGFMLLLGNAYIYGAGPDAGNNAGMFQQLYILPAHLMQIVSDGVMDPVSAYKLLYRGGQQELPAERIMHGKYWTPDYTGPGSHLYGLSPLRAASIVTQMSNDSYTAAGKMFQNMGPPGVLYMDDGTVEQWTPEQQQAVEATYNAKYGGPNKAGSPIISSAKISYTQIGLSAVDMNIIASQEHSLRTLCNIYGVSSSLFNDGANKTFNNVDAARKDLVTNACLPQLVRTRDDLNRWFMPGFKNTKMYLDFDLSVYPEMAVDLSTTATMLGASWWLTPNEKRQAMGYEPNEDEPLMDQCLIPNTMMPIEDLDAIPQIDQTELGLAVTNDSPAQEPDEDDTKPAKAGSKAA